MLVGLRTPDFGWARRLVLRLGGRARVLSPPELAAEVRDYAGRALARYAEGVAAEAEKMAR
jgi:proteasome accessory factor C